MIGEWQALLCILAASKPSGDVLFVGSPRDSDIINGVLRATDITTRVLVLETPDRPNPTFRVADLRFGAHVQDILSFCHDLVEPRFDLVVDSTGRLENDIGSDATEALLKKIREGGFLISTSASAAIESQMRAASLITHQFSGYVLGTKPGAAQPGGRKGGRKRKRPDAPLSQ